MSSSHLSISILLPMLPFVFGMDFYNWQQLHKCLPVTLQIPNSGVTSFSENQKKNCLIRDAWLEQQLQPLHEFPPHRADVFSSGWGLEACIAADSSVTILRVFNQVTSRSEDYQVVCKRIKYSYGSLVGTDVTCAKTNGKFPFF